MGEIKANGGCPWQFTPKKDVCLNTISTMSLLAGVISRRFLNGAIQSDVSRIILPQGRRGTRRTETSKYPEEKTSYEISSVAASERGRA